MVTTWMDIHTHIDNIGTRSWKANNFISLLFYPCGMFGNRIFPDLMIPTESALQGWDNRTAASCEQKHSLSPVSRRVRRLSVE